MELFEFGTNPWGQDVLVRISLDVLYLFFWAAVAFIGFHIVYAAVWVPKLARAAADAETAGAAAVPAKITRHTGPARAFHWVMAASMLALLATGFLPLVGVQFPWLTIHWVAGILLTISILYHMVHATFFLDFWSIWILPKDIQEAIKRAKRQLGRDVQVPKHGKYPLDHKMYHTAVMLAGMAVVATGLLMLFKIDTPLVTPNAHLFSLETWGIMYAVHGLTGAMFVMLTFTHIYFAMRPDKFWMTRSMLFGSIDREKYLDHHDPARWVVPQESSEG